MIRLGVVVALAWLCACGPLGPPGKDGGAGGGAATGGGVGGGASVGGGGGVTGGGGGGGASTGGGGASTGGGGGATGGGGGAADAGVPPLTWASIALSGVTGSGPILGLGGVAGDLWALQDNGNLYHSTGGAFALQDTFTGGVKALHVVGNTIVVVQYRSIQWCTANCTATSAFTGIDLISLQLDGEAACGKNATTFAVIVSDVNSMAQLYEWNGAGFTRTNQSLGVRYPRACWYDASGALNISGENKIIQYDQGAATPQVITTNATTFMGGFDLEGTSWTVGQNGAVARRTGSAWSPFTTSSTGTLWTVGGLRADEIFAFGYFQSSVGNGYKWNGTALVPTGDLLPNGGSMSLFRSMLITSPTELYVGGQNASGPVVVRGRR